MKYIITFFGILILFGGISLVIAPNIIFDIFEDEQYYNSLYIPAIVLRAALGVLLISAAHKSKHPTANRILGGIALVAAIIFILIGHDGFSNLITELISIMKPFARLSGIFAVAFGGFIIYSFLGNESHN